MSLRIPYRTVRPGANFSTDVVVQDFSGALPVGNHVVSYSIRIRAHAKDPLDPILIEGDGLLSISIATGSDAEMTGILTNLTSRIGDYWSDREAEQAICATTSPLVLPFLGDVSRFTWSDCEVDALINFRGNKEAEALLETFVLSPRTSMKALGVAKDLRYRLPMSTITQLLNRKWQTLETLYYLGALADPAYLPAITRFLDDPDSVVAGAAARAQTKVLAAKQ
jgi:hypothetical protein